MRDFHTPLVKAAIGRQIQRSSDISDICKQNCTGSILKQCKQSDNKKTLLEKTSSMVRAKNPLEQSSIPLEQSFRLCLIMSLIQA